MGHEGIPKEVQDFIARYIGSVEQLEVLLLLHRHRGREWSAEAVAKELYVEQASATKRLKEFAAAGLLATRKGSSEQLYQFPTSGEQDRIVTAVAQSYKERRVSMINLIFSNPLDNIRSFSDAFRFRREDEE